MLSRLIVAALGQRGEKSRERRKRPGGGLRSRVGDDRQAPYVMDIPVTGRRRRRKPKGEANGDVQPVIPGRRQGADGERSLFAGCASFRFNLMSSSSGRSKL